MLLLGTHDHAISTYLPVYYQLSTLLSHVIQYEVSKQPLNKYLINVDSKAVPDLSVTAYIWHCMEARGKLHLRLS